MVRLPGKRACLPALTICVCFIVGCVPDTTVFEAGEVTVIVERHPSRIKFAHTGGEVFLEENLDSFSPINCLPCATICDDPGLPLISDLCGRYGSIGFTKAEASYTPPFISWYFRYFQYL